MPLELIVESPRKVAFVAYEDREPDGNEVLIRTTVSGIKHGTEVNVYRGIVPFADQVWDPDLRLFRSLREGEEAAPFFPHKVGSWASGVVIRVGPEVRRFKPGDRVHGEWRHRQTAIMPEDTLYPIKDGVPDETMVFTDPARFALAGVHDAAIEGALAGGAAEIVVVDSHGATKDNVLWDRLHLHHDQRHDHPAPLPDARGGPVLRQVGSL
jgi:threonine dehydrogenase-like Zn-dependent dehydrogenase